MATPNRAHRWDSLATSCHPNILHGGPSTPNLALASARESGLFKLPGPNRSKFRRDCDCAAARDPIVAATLRPHAPCRWNTRALSDLTVNDGNSTPNDQLKRNDTAPARLLNGTTLTGP
jgi:hypothetical protein